MDHPAEMTNPTGRGRYARRSIPVENKNMAVLLHMPISLVNRLDAEATQRGLNSRAELIRQACEAFLSKIE